MLVRTINYLKGLNAFVKVENPEADGWKSKKVNLP